MYELAGCIAKIERDETKAARTQKKIRGAKTLLQRTAAHPQEPFQVNACGFRRLRIEGVASVDERTCLRMARSRAQSGKQQAGATRAGRAENLCERAAR